MNHFIVAVANWWNGAFGRRTAFKEGASIAFDNAAMKAWDMGQPEIRNAINELKDRFLA